MEKVSSRKRNNNNKSYCWTHGRTRNNNHLSSTCINKKAGHQDDATLSNHKGGSDRFCNEWQIGSTNEETINKLSKLREIIKTYSHLNFTCNSLCSVIPYLPLVNAYADSGATNTYFRLRDVKNHKTKTTNPINVQHAGGKYMTSSHITTLDLPILGNKKKYRTCITWITIGIPPFHRTIMRSRLHRAF